MYLFLWVLKAHLSFICSTRQTLTHVPHLHHQNVHKCLTIDNTTMTVLIALLSPDSWCCCGCRSTAEMKTSPFKKKKNSNVVKCLQNESRFFKRQSLDCIKNAMFFPFQFLTITLAPLNLFKFRHFVLQAFFSPRKKPLTQRWCLFTKVATGRSFLGSFLKCQRCQDK